MLHSLQLSAVDSAWCDRYAAIEKSATLMKDEIRRLRQRPAPPPDTSLASIIAAQRGTIAKQEEELDAMKRLHEQVSPHPATCLHPAGDTWLVITRGLHISGRRHCSEAPY